MMLTITAITAHAVEPPNFVIIYADDLGIHADKRPDDERSS